MSKVKTKKELKEHKDNAIHKISEYIDTLITSTNSKNKERADKLCYWLEDYIRFLNYEKDFKPTSYQKYKKGQVIKVHLGYNIGSEEGGLHYAIVIDNNNSIHSPILNVIPLTSVKKNTKIEDIRQDLGQIFLGNELYRLLIAKTRFLSKSITDEYNKLIYESSTQDKDMESYEKLEEIEKDIEFCNRMINEIERMNKGSIALVGQITTVSKIRIYDPKTSRDVLSNIRMSNETLDKIDEAIRKMYTKKEGSAGKIVNKQKIYE